MKIKMVAPNHVQEMDLKKAEEILKNAFMRPGAVKVFTEGGFWNIEDSTGRTTFYPIEESNESTSNPGQI